MSVSLRENITAVIETCFSETKDEIQDTAINRILELIRTDRKDELQRDCFLCKWLGDVDVCGRCRNRNLFAEADTEPQTEYPCNTCANKGDHNGECSNCIVDSETIRWKTPSHYEPKTESQMGKNFPRRTEKPIQIAWVNEDLDVLGKTKS